MPPSPQLPEGSVPTPEEYFAHRHVRFGRVRILGPRRLQDSVVQGVVARSLEDAGVEDPSGRGAPLGVVLDALRRSAASLYTIGAIRECRFMAVPGTSADSVAGAAGEGAGGSDAAAARVPDSHDPALADTVDAVVWIEDAVRRRWGAGATGSPSATTAGGSVYASATAEHLVGLGDTLDARVSWGVAGSSREREIDVTWSAPVAPPRCVDDGEGGLEVPSAPVASAALYANDEQFGAGVSWRVPRAGLKVSVSSEVGEDGIGTQTAGLYAEWRELVAARGAPLRVSDDAGPNTRIGATHSFSATATIPQLHNLFPRRGLSLNTDNEIFYSPTDSSTTVKSVSSLRAFWPLRKMLSTLSLGARFAATRTFGSTNGGRPRVCDLVSVDLPGYLPGAVGPRAARSAGEPGGEFLGAGLACAVDARVMAPIPAPALLSNGVFAQAFVAAGGAVDWGLSAPSALLRTARTVAGFGIVKSGAGNGFDIALNVNFPIRSGPTDNFCNFQLSFQSQES